MNLACLRSSFIIGLVCLAGVGCNEIALVTNGKDTTTPPTSPTTDLPDTTTPDPTTVDETGDSGTTGPGTTDTGVPMVPGQLVLGPSQDALVVQNNPDVNYGDWIELSAGTWTASGIPYSIRSLFAFDLAALPVDATDVVAHLDLYAETTSRMYGQGVFNGEPPGHSTLTASNAFRLRRTLDPWDETTVTWNTQPAVDPVVSVWQASSTAPDQDYLQIDVTPLVLDAIAAGETEASWVLHQAVEVHYGEVTFATGDHTDPALHPRLTLDYGVPAP